MDRNHQQLKQPSPDQPGLDDMALSSLPEVLAEYARETSMRDALELAVRAGGHSHYVPHDPAKDTRLTRAVGREATAVLLRIFGPGRLLIPLGPIGTGAQRRLEILRLINDGASVAAIVRQLRCHERTVYRHKRGRNAAADPRQDKLL